MSKKRQNYMKRVPPTLTLLVVKATLEALRDREVLDLKGRIE